MFNKKIVLVVSICLSLFCTVALAAAAKDVRTVTRLEGNLDVEYPFIMNGFDDEGTDTINEDINKIVQNFYAAAEEHNETAKMRYQIQKADAKVLSIVFNMTAWDYAGSSYMKTLGLNYERHTGAKLNLSDYYSESEVLSRARNGLQYIYNFATPAEIPLPDTFYVAEDGNVIAAFAPGMVADKSEGMIEIDLTASEAGAVDNSAPADSQPSDLLEHSVAQVQEEAISKRAKITGTEVRARSIAGMESDVLGEFTQGESVVVLAKAFADDREWYKVTRLDGQTCWVAAEYCATTSGQGKITGTEVRLRGEAGSHGDILNFFELGEIVEVIGDTTINGQLWYKVNRTNGETGWVSGDYCSVE